MVGPGQGLPYLAPLRYAGTSVCPGCHWLQYCPFSDLADETLRLHTLRTTSSELPGHACLNQHMVMEQWHHWIVTEAMHLDQLETVLVGSSSLDRLTSIVQSERANAVHPGSTGGNTLVDVKKGDLSSCPTCPLSEKSRGSKLL